MPLSWLGEMPTKLMSGCDAAAEASGAVLTYVSTMASAVATLDTLDVTALKLIFNSTNIQAVESA